MPASPTYREWVGEINLDKARYNPGEEVHIEVELIRNFEGRVEVAYRHLTELVDQQELSINGASFSLEFQPPQNDFKGYLAEITFFQEETEVGYASVGIDISSDWTRFPRYGFLSKFGPDISLTRAQSTLTFLNRLHLNSLQFYDWHYKHHLPLPLINNVPQPSWQDIARRTISLQTVDTYIAEAKIYNMASMSYNLLYGAWEDYAADGISEEWLLFNDAAATEVNRHFLDDNFAQSDILLLNPANPQWQAHIFEETQTIYDHLDFEGWHLDQLGDRGNVYDYEGNKLTLGGKYGPFLEALHTRFPNKAMVLNAVNQYGQASILNTEVDFAYTEVWPPNETYDDLARIIGYNEGRMGQAGKTVLAAYMNYDLADQAGSFNEPAVLMTDAVIMAFGGMHLEWGEHMLGKEYFPNDNLQVSPSAREKLITYYDFLTGYQNVLREGESVNRNPGVNSSEVAIADWPGQIGQIAAISRVTNGLTAYHLLNFIGLNSLNWRDNTGTQTSPNIQGAFTLEIAENEVNEVFYISPDFEKGHAHPLNFTLDNGVCRVTVPYLEYWGVILIK